MHRAGTRGRVSELASLFVVVVVVVVVFLFSLSLSLSLSLFRARDVDNRLPSLGLDCACELLTAATVIILPPTASTTDKTVRVAD